jgi:hypothetical protein
LPQQGTTGRRGDAEVDENYKSQNPNNKWFDKLTTLSQVEGQIPMTKIQNSKPSHHLKRIQICLGH